MKRVGRIASAMIRRRLVVSTVLLSSIGLGAEPVQKRVFNREEATIRRMATRFAETWNAHDMDAMADLFSDDADFVNVGGERLHGRQRIRDVHAQRHAMQFKESVMTIRSVTVRFLEPDVAVAHVDWSLEGDRDPDGTSRAARQGVTSWTVAKRDGTWRIESAHNTNRRSTAAQPP